VKPKILVSVPNTGWIHRNVAFSLLRIMGDQRVSTNIIMPVNIPYENNLNKITRQFLKEEYDFWLNIDSDNPPKNNPIDLVFLNLDLVGLPTPVWANMKEGDYPIYWNGLDEKQSVCTCKKTICECADVGWSPHKNMRGLQEVDAIGTGCFIVSRRVMLSIKKPFVREVDEDGCVTRGHDYLFCKRVKEGGFRIFCHYDYPCQHFHELEIGEIAGSMMMVKNG